jgi:antitoxin (DNA-binding transcriptional repressor) of toxin-antitoxin stability system
MKMISTRDLKLKASDTWQLLDKEGELVVTSHGKPVALLSNISEGDIEATLDAIRRARAQVAVSNMRRSARQEGLDRMSGDEIEGEIEAVRKSRPQS